VSLSETGALLLQGVLPVAQVQRWSEAAEAAYQSPAVRQAHGFVATASSMKLAALDLPHIIDTVYGALGPTLVAGLGGPVSVNLDEAWLRRQWPPEMAPRFHHPHGWHQDGALGHDFLHGAAADGLVPMLTVWAPLTPCGVVAPGLEVVPGRQAGLRPMEALVPARFDPQFPAPTRWRPSMQPGDVLVFHGDVLHRTAPAEAMTRARTSIGLRWGLTASLPRRLAHQRWHPLR
jgi:hypothetical protein